MWCTLAFDAKVFILLSWFYSNGAIVSCEAHGTVNVNCRLSGKNATMKYTGFIITTRTDNLLLMNYSGMPDLALNFINHRILDDVSFHPCVRSVPRKLWI
jgi:AP-3 complex subunit mu